VTIASNCVNRSRVASLIPERSRQPHHDLVLGPSRIVVNEVGRFVEVAFVVEGRSCAAFDDGIDESLPRWASCLQQVVHPDALSICERDSNGLAMSRYLAKGEHYPITRGRNVNILV
jgi:hypothetical protein